MGIKHVSPDFGEWGQIEPICVNLCHRLSAGLKLHWSFEH